MRGTKPITQYEDQYGTQQEPMIDLHDWNDVANTEIPLKYH